MHSRTLKRFGSVALVVLVFAGLAPAARAEMVLSKVIVDLQPGQRASDDIEVWNDGDDRLYIAAEPAQILEAGTVAQRREPALDPGNSGILVSPQRLILEPGQRRVIRLASVLPRAEKDRVYRVTVKPVAGPLNASGDALKVYVGYDVLVLQRPETVSGEVRGERTGDTLKFVNGSNTSWEIYDGRQCDRTGKNCIELVATRLYAGAEWTVDLRYDTPVEYSVTNGMTTIKRQF